MINGQLSLLFANKAEDQKQEDVTDLNEVKEVILKRSIA